MGCNSSKQDGYESQHHATAANPDDPKKSAGLKEEALKVAEEMMGLSRGKRFHENYTRLTLTSYGASCKVLTAYHRTTNKKVAVKTIPKSRKQLERQRAKVMLEIGTFRMVEDHPNAVRVLEIFEGAECYYIVMECCEGGELFDHISKKQGCFTERQAAGLLRSLMLFLAHMHSKGIAHLDIKPENVMFDSEGASGVLKVLDFGSSVFVQPNETVRNAFGTVRYASPEMANDVCGQKADIWSAGVVMYILLCGRAPFLKANDIDTLNYIKDGPRVRFNGERWASISQSAKDCIKVLLEPSPRLRPTAVEVLAMPWLKQQVPETVIVPDTLKHLRTFANQSRIRRLLLGLMADQLVGSGANQLLGQFYTLDKDFSGVLEVSELVKAAKEAIPELSESEINRMFEALDVDRTGTVDIKEFFAGLIQTIDEEKQTLVAQKSFTMLDKRGSGFVTKEAFMEVLLERAQAGTLRTMGPQAEGGQQQVADMRLQRGRGSGPDGADGQVILDPGLVQELESEFAYLDANGDGVLSFEEFKAILGITSTPEGLTLAQPQLVAVPSIQEGMETLAASLRTRTCSFSKGEDQHRQASTQRLTLGRVSQSGGGAASAASAGGAAAGGGAGGANSVDRAHLDLELPYDMETRDLLQLLAPAAKRTVSQAPPFQRQQSTGGGGSIGRSATAGALIPGHPGCTATASVTAPSAAASGGGGGGAMNGVVGGGGQLPAATAASITQSATSLRLSRVPSSSTSIPAVALLDKMPSMRAPSLPPLPPRGTTELDGNGGSMGAWRPSLESPMPRQEAVAEARGGGGGWSAVAAQQGYAATAVDHPSLVRWVELPNSASPPPAGAEGWVSTAGGVAEGRELPGLSAAAGTAVDDAPLLGCYAGSSGPGTAEVAGGGSVGGDRRRPFSASG